jgi:site-specific DNA-methyltransferase (adenine-specific)
MALTCSPERFAELEATIERGRRTFLEVGRALIEVRDSVAYRAHAGYATFEAYLEHRWGMARQTGYDYIHAVEVAANVRTAVHQPLPMSHLVALAPLPASEQRELAAAADLAALSVRLVRELAAAPAPVRLEIVRQATAGAEPRELRALMRHASARLALAAPAPAAQQERPTQRRLDHDDIVIEVLDAARTAIADGAFDLVVSSPPYALDVPYADGGDVPDYPTYRRCMATWSAELYRVAHPGHGRLCLEVPVDRSKEGVYEPVYAHWLHALEAAGFGYRTTIFRRYHAGRGTARGSEDSPAGPHVFAPLLAIIVMCRGTWLRRSDRPHDLGHDDWLKLAGPNGYWDDIPGEMDPEHPKPFHLEVPRRLLKLYSYRDDLVGDLFLGSGTTALACVELGRRFRGGDRSPTYVAMAQERAAAALDREAAA